MPSSKEDGVRVMGLLVGIAPQQHERAAAVNGIEAVELQKARRDPSGGGERSDHAIDGVKMVCPARPTGMVERDNRPCLGVERTEVAAFAAVALGAGEAEVVAAGRAAVFLGDDVVDFVGEEPVILMHAAVFAALPRPLDDCAAERVGDMGRHACSASSFSWARIFSRATRLSNWM